MNINGYIAANLKRCNIISAQCQSFIDKIDTKRGIYAARHKKQLSGFSAVPE